MLRFLVLALSLCGTLALPSARSAADAGDSSGPCGRMLYMQHCADCHGERGFGDGPMAASLDPRPRDFSAYHFRLVSTENGVPTDQDLFDTITRGMIGSAMPPHGHLDVEARWALVGYLRQLMTVEGARRLMEEAEKAGEEMDEESARGISFRDPGPVYEAPPEIECTAEILSEGRRLYVKNCAGCHDLDGSGRTRRDMVDSLDYPLRARDFASGVLKGGASRLDLLRRIRLGMPGTPMPAHKLPDRDLWALTHYTFSMMRPGAQEHLTQRRRVLMAPAIQGTLSEDPGAGLWRDLPSTWLPLTQLLHGDGRIEGVLVQAVHNKKRLALRLSWEDRTPPLEGASRFGDAALLRFSERETPPFIGTGRTEASIESWQWIAQRGGQQILPPGVSTGAHHGYGFWSVVFIRDLKGMNARFELDSGTELSLSFELWKDAAGWDDGHRNLSIWHRLRLLAKS